MQRLNVTTVGIYAYMYAVMMAILSKHCRAYLDYSFSRFVLLWIESF